MELNEILKLDKVTASIKKIDLFLAGVSKKSLAYYQAFCYRNIILHALGKTNEALKALYSLVVDFNKMSDEVVIVICDAIIEITISVDRLDQAEKYMDIKKSHLKVSNQALAIRDQILLELARKNYKGAIEYLKQYINDEISNEETLWANEHLARIYYEIHHYNAYLDVSNLLERIYRDRMNHKALIQLLYTRLLIADEEGNYIKVIHDANQVINDYELDETMTIQVVILLLKSYLKCKDYHKASIIESNYESLLEQVPPEIALEYAKVCIELYNQSNLVFNVNHYEKMAEEKSQLIKKSKKKDKPASRVLIPKIPDELDESSIESEEAHQEVLEEKYEPKTMLVSKQYEHLEKLFHLLSNQDPNIRFRETFRLTMIELATLVSFKEAYLVYFYQGEYNGIHYKMDRAYDKKLDFEQLDDTINFLAITKEQIVFLDEENKTGLKDIVTKKAYEMIPYGIALPLSKEEVVYASVAFFAEENFVNQDLAYESIKLIAQMLNKALIEWMNQLEARASNKKMFFIYENMTSGVKELLEGNIHLSKQAKEMLDSFEDLTEQEYKNHIHPKDLPGYQKVIDELYQLMPDHREIQYQFKKNNEYITIKETFFPCYENGTISLYSLLEDITKNVEVQEKLLSLAYTNPTSQLSTEVKLMVDLKSQLNQKKLSLAVIDVHDFKLYEEFYGLTFVNQLILAIAGEFKMGLEKYFNAYLYHLGFDRYAILFTNMNDKRTIDHILLEVFEKTTKNIHLINSRVTLYFNCGVYRVSKSQTNITDDKVFSYAYDALNDAKDMHTLEHHICHFDSENAKKRFTENQLITHISEGIDHNKIGLSYKQVVHTETKEIFAYITQIALDSMNVDKGHLQQVIKRKGLEELMDKYMISNGSKEIRMLRENTHAKIYVMVSLSEASINDTLVDFIETQNQFYKTTKSNMIFIVEDASNPVIMALKRKGYHIAGTNLIDVYQEYIDYYIFDLKRYGSVMVPEIQKLCQEKRIQLIMSHVDTKEDITRCIQMHIQYLYGDYYKKTIRMKKVIEKLS